MLNSKISKKISEGSLFIKSENTSKKLSMMGG